MAAVATPDRWRTFWAYRKTNVLPGPRHERHGERQDDEHRQPTPEPDPHGTEDRHRVVARRLGHEEPVGLGHPPGDHRHQCEGDQGQGDGPPEPERRRGQAVHDRGEPGPDPVAGGHQGDRLGPVGRGRLLGRHHLGQRAGGAQERPAQREHGDEPPVARTHRRCHGDRQPGGHGHQQQRPTAEPVGQPGERERQQRRQPDDGEPGPEHRPRQPRLVGDGGPLGDPTERPGDVAERGDDTELAEAGGDRGEHHADHRPGPPRVEVERGSRAGTGRGEVRTRGHGHSVPEPPVTLRGSTVVVGASGPCLHPADPS